MRRKGKVDGTLGIEQIFVQSLGEPQRRLEGWGVEGQVKKVCEARSRENVGKAKGP